MILIMVRQQLEKAFEYNNKHYFFAFVACDLAPHEALGFLYGSWLSQKH